MNAKEKLERANKLIEIYGELLTPKQLKIMKDKYQYDLSYQEIALNYKITRQAAEDSIRVSYNKLEEFEKKLNLIMKKEKVLNIIKDKDTKKKIKDIL